jgi:hypothetical protein
MLLRLVRSKIATKENSRGPTVCGYSLLHCSTLACCIAFAACVTSTAYADPFLNSASSFSTPHPSVVRVVAPERDGTSYGSGSLVAVDETSGLVLTNWHVVRDAAGPIVVHFPDGFHSGAVLLRVDRDWDLAALAIRRPNVQPIPLASQTPQPGDPLTIIGYGGGSYRAVTGQCTQYVSPGDNFPMEMVELSAPARNGDSGGPILNSRGELAGVLFGTAFGRTTGSYCGRVRGFVTTVEGDFRTLSHRVMLADQSRRTSTPATPASLAVAPPAAQEVPSNAPIGNEAVATEWTPPRPTMQPLVRQSQSPAVLSTVSCSKPLVAKPSPDSNPICSIPGPTATVSPVGPISKTEQVKTILALIGVVAILWQGLRLLGAAVG